MKIVTLDRLNRAEARVIRELEALDLWTPRVAAVGVYLVPVGHALGWKYDGRHGFMAIPAVVLSRLAYKLFGIGATRSLVEILRHEYGHVVADTYRKYTRHHRFKSAFGGTYDSGKPVGCYDPREYVTGYASSEPAEDFSETFMYYVKYRGALPPRFDTAAIRRKWKYIAWLTRQIGKHAA